ncbi:MAG: ATP-binding cassette, subfamily er 3 [Chloroflexota bacterium]|nr:ATP-binding cassette, subfamily er 3 [Chloroflexota bacterium]
MSLISTSNLAKSFGSEDIFSDITFAVPQKARIGLVGSNGVGKTTLLRILIGEESASEGSVQRSKNLRIGYLPQEAVLESGKTLWDECLAVFEELLGWQAQLRAMDQRMGSEHDDPEFLEKYGRLQERFELAGGYTFENDIERTLTGLGFARDEFHKPLNILSGGQRTRAYLAELLLSNPDLLLLDEPTNHLDIQAMEWLEGYLKNWEGAVVLVSHDRYFLDRTVSAIWEMTPALEVYHGNYSAYLEQREARYERQLKEYESQQEFIAKEEDYIRRNIAGQNTKQAQGRRRRLERLLADARLAPPQKSRRIHFYLKADNRSGDLVLRTYDLQVGYHDDKKVLIHVPDLVLTRGECVAIMGPNGAGKTTFLKTLLDNIPPLGGRVSLGSAVQVGYFAQAHEGLHDNWTLVQEVQNAAPNMLEEEARGYLATFLFSGDDAFKEVGVLSGGERGRLAIACLALQGSNLLLLDEPTNHLDLPSQEILQRVLAEFNGTVLLVSHDRYLVDAVATQIWELEPDQSDLTVFKGSYSELRAEQEESQAQAQTQKKSNKSAARSNGSDDAKKKSINPKVLRELEEQISTLEEQLEEVTRKLEHPLEVNESVADLGRQYNDVQEALERKWQTWNDLFLD